MDRENTRRFQKQQQQLMDKMSARENAMQEAAEDAQPRRFHLVFFLFFGWWLVIGLIAVIAALHGLPLILLVFKGFRRFVSYLFGYY